MINSTHNLSGNQYEGVNEIINEGVNDGNRPGYNMAIPGSAFRRSVANVQESPVHNVQDLQSSSSSSLPTMPLSVCSPPPGPSHDPVHQTINANAGPLQSQPQDHQSRGLPESNPVWRNDRLTPFYPRPRYLSHSSLAPQTPWYSYSPIPYPHSAPGLQTLRTAPTLNSSYSPYSHYSHYSQYLPQYSSLIPTSLIPTSEQSVRNHDLSQNQHFGTPGQTTADFSQDDPGPASTNRVQKESGNISEEIPAKIMTRSSQTDKITSDDKMVQVQTDVLMQIASPKQPTPVSTFNLPGKVFTNTPTRLLPPKFSIIDNKLSIVIDLSTFNGDHVVSQGLLEVKKNVLSTLGKFRGLEGTKWDVTLKPLVVFPRSSLITDKSTQQKPAETLIAGGTCAAKPKTAPARSSSLPPVPALLSQPKANQASTSPYPTVAFSILKNNSALKTPSQPTLLEDLPASKYPLPQTLQEVPPETESTKKQCSNEESVIKTTSINEDSVANTLNPTPLPNTASGSRDMHTVPDEEIKGSAASGSPAEPQRPKKPVITTADRKRRLTSLSNHPVSALEGLKSAVKTFLSRQTGQEITITCANTRLISVAAKLIAGENLSGLVNELQQKRKPTKRKRRVHYLNDRELSRQAKVQRAKHSKDLAVALASLKTAIAGYKRDISHPVPEEQNEIMKLAAEIITDQHSNRGDLRPKRRRKQTLPCLIDFF